MQRAFNAWKVNQQHNLKSKAPLKIAGLWYLNNFIKGWFQNSGKPKFNF
jgi:hypothetical protein